MTETNHAAIGADTLTDEQILAIASDPATCPALPWWFKDEVVSSDVRDSLLRFARAVERAALAGAAQPTNDWAQSAAELIAMRGYLADSADTPRVAHLLAQIVPATQHMPTDPAGVRRLLDKHCASIKYGAPDGTPHEGDRYSVTAHDILEAFAWWVDGGGAHPMSRRKSSQRIFILSLENPDTLIS